MRSVAILLIALLFQQNVYSQTPAKQLQAKRTTASIKIDGNLDDAAWKEVTPATNFIEQRPNPGKIEENMNRTEIYLLYDNTSVYVGGYCHERTKDSISKN